MVSLIISQKLPPEAIAIVEATAADVRARQAAIIFRAWHHLETEPARRLLFEQFTLDGHLVGLIDAIVATAKRGRWAGMAPFLPLLPRAERESLDATLEGALMRALHEVLDVSAMVLNAWRDAVRFFMSQLRPAQV